MPPDYHLLSLYSLISVNQNVFRVRFRHHVLVRGVCAESGLVVAPVWIGETGRPPQTPPIPGLVFNRGPIAKYRRASSGEVDMHGWSNQTNSVLPFRAHTPLYRDYLQQFGLKWQSCIM